MKQPCSRFSRSPANDRGVTLIEAVLGLVILGTIVASIAIARGRALRQYAAAEMQIRAAHVADAMIGGWLGGPPQAIPLRDSGPVAELPGCVWRTRPRPADPQAEQLGAVIVNFEIVDLKQPAQLPMLSIDFAVPAAPAGGNRINP